MKASLLGAAVAAVAPLDLLGGTKGRPKKGGAELKISLQEGVTPGETLKEKLRLHGKSWGCRPRA